MRYFSFIIIFLSGLVCNAETITDRFVFATKEKASELLKTKDSFTEAWSDFDIKSRLQKQNGTKAELFALIGSQTLSWSDKEKEVITKAIKSIAETIDQNKYHIILPEKIYLVKTTAKEEGGAGGYTRANYIVLKDDVGNLSEAELKELVCHELFHVISRNDPALRKKLYKLIGFTITKELEYPKSLKDLRITNPDCPLTDSYITLKKDSAEVNCFMVLYAKKNYDTGVFFDYLKIGFVELGKDLNYDANSPKINSFKDITGFYEQVGRNTNYIINPEEVIADNFTLVVCGAKEPKTPELLDRIKQKLKE